MYWAGFGDYKLSVICAGGNNFVCTGTTNFSLPNYSINNLYASIPSLSAIVARLRGNIMTSEKRKKRLKQALKNRLKDILNNMKEIKSTIHIIYSYCKYRNDSETVGNILHMLAELEEKTESTAMKICDILNEDNALNDSEFMSHILPLNLADVVIDD